MAENNDNDLISVIWRHLEEGRGDYRAIYYRGEAVTYEKMCRMVDQLVKQLQNDVGDNFSQRIAIYMEPSPQYVVAVLAILKAGFEFLPLDLAKQDTALKECLDVVKPCLVLTTAETYAAYSGFELRMAPNIQFKKIDLTDLEKNNMVAAETKFLSPIRSDQFAYTIFTSGSSGKEKAVHVRHEGIVLRMQSIIEFLKISNKDVIAQYCPLHFDASLQEIFTALIAGATLKIIPQSIRTRIDHLVSNYEVMPRVTITTLVPIVLERLEPEKLPGLRAIISTGAQSATNTVKAWLQEKGENFIFCNGFGATEETIGSHLAKLVIGADNEIDIHLGIPMAGVHRAYRTLKDDETLLDEDQVELGTNYELVTYGKGINNEYLPSGASLSRNPFFDYKNNPAYLTGDIVQFSAGSQLKFVARMNRSLKRYGALIDLDKIDRVLQEENTLACNIAESYTYCDRELQTKKNSDELDLIIFLKKFHTNLAIDYQQLNYLLNQRVRLQELPSHVVEVDEVPRKPSKESVDEKKLIETNLDKVKQIRGQNKTELDAIEKRIEKIWNRILGFDGYAFFRDDNFLNYCPSSLKYAEMISAVIKEFEKDFQEESGRRNIFHLDLEHDFRNEATLGRLAREVRQVIPIENFQRLQHLHGLDKIRLRSRKAANNINSNIIAVLVHTLSGDADFDYASAHDLSSKLKKIGGELYTITAPPLTNAGSMPGTIEEMAKHYNAAINEVNGFTNYEHVLLIGWSAGGVIAYEMLHQLQHNSDIDHKKITVFMLDSLSPAHWQQMSNSDFSTFLKDVPSRTNISKEQFIVNPDDEKFIQLNELDQFAQPVTQRTARKGKKNRKKSQSNVASVPKEDHRPQRVAIVKGILRNILNYHVPSHVGNVYLYTAGNPEVKGVQAGDKNKLEWPDSVMLARYCHQHKHSNILKDKDLVSDLISKVTYYQERLYYNDVINYLHGTYSRQIIKLPFLNRDLSIEDFYIETALCENEAIPDSPDLEDDLEEAHITKNVTRKAIDLEQLAKIEDEEQSHVIITGRSGIGKTVFMQHLAYQWSQGKLWHNTCDILMIIPLRYLPGFIDKSGNDSIGFILSVLNLDVKDQPSFRHFLENYFSGKITKLRIKFLFDGFDEVSHYLNDKYRNHQALLNNLLRSAGDYVITTQPDRLSELTAIANTTTYFTLSGFNLEAVSNFTINLFDRIGRTRKEGENFVQWIIDNENLESLASIPMLLVLICSVSSSLLNIGKELTISELYGHVLEGLCYHYMIKQKVSAEINRREAMESSNSILKVLSSLALSATMAQRASFDEEWVKQVFCGGNFDTLFEAQAQAINRKGGAQHSFALEQTRFNQLIDTGCLLNQGNGRVSFVHQDLQRYLAAFYIANAWTGQIRYILPDNNVWRVSERKLFIKKFAKLPHMFDVCVFLARMLENYQPAQIVEQEESDDEDDNVDVKSTVLQPKVSLLQEYFNILEKVKIDEYWPDRNAFFWYKEERLPVSWQLPLASLYSVDNPDVVQRDKLLQQFAPIVEDILLNAHLFHHQTLCNEVIDFLLTYRKLLIALEIVKKLQSYLQQPYVISKHSHIKVILLRLSKRKSLENLLKTASEESDQDIRWWMVESIARMPLTTLKRYHQSIVDKLQYVASAPAILSLLCLRSELIDDKIFQMITAWVNNTKCLTETLFYELTHVLIRLDEEGSFGFQGAAKVVNLLVKLLQIDHLDERDKKYRRAKLRLGIVLVDHYIVSRAMMKNKGKTFSFESVIGVAFLEILKFFNKDRAQYLRQVAMDYIRIIWWDPSAQPIKNFLSLIFQEQRYVEYIEQIPLIAQVYKELCSKDEKIQLAQKLNKWLQNAKKFKNKIHLIEALGGLGIGEKNSVDLLKNLIHFDKNKFDKYKKESNEVSCKAVIAMATMNYFNKYSLYNALKLNPDEISFHEKKSGFIYTALASIYLSGQLNLDSQDSSQWYDTCFLRFQNSENVYVKVKMIEMMVRLVTRERLDELVNNLQQLCSEREDSIIIIITVMQSLDYLISSSVINDFVNHYSKFVCQLLTLMRHKHASIRRQAIELLKNSDITSAFGESYVDALLIIMSSDEQMKVRFTVLNLFRSWYDNNIVGEKNNVEIELAIRKRLFDVNLVIRLHALSILLQQEVNYNDDDLKTVFKSDIQVALLLDLPADFKEIVEVLKKQLQTLMDKEEDVQNQSWLETIMQEFQQFELKQLQSANHKEHYNVSCAARRKAFLSNPEQSNHKAIFELLMLPSKKHSRVETRQGSTNDSHSADSNIHSDSIHRIFASTPKKQWSPKFPDGGSSSSAMIPSPAFSTFLSNNAN